MEATERGGCLSRCFQVSLPEGHSQKRREEDGRAHRLMTSPCRRAFYRGFF